MIALALSEDSISKRAHRDTIIESLAQLPESTRKARGYLPAVAMPDVIQRDIKCFDHMALTTTMQVIVHGRYSMTVPETVRLCAELRCAQGVQSSNHIMLTKRMWGTPQVLLLDEQMKELARRLMNDGSLLLFGRGYNYATALEAALKVKEVALMHRHGPTRVQPPVWQYQAVRLWQVVTGPSYHTPCIVACDVVVEPCAHS